MSRRIAIYGLALGIQFGLFLPCQHPARAAQDTVRVATLTEQEIGGPGYGLDKQKGWFIAFDRNFTFPVSTARYFQQFGLHEARWFTMPIVVYTVEGVKAKVGDATTAMRSELAGTKADLLKAIAEVGRKSLEEQQFRDLKTALRDELQQEMRKEFKEELKREIVAELKTDKAFRDGLKNEILAEIRSAEK